MLETESRYFAEHLADWLEKHSNRVALIKGESLIGFFDNEHDAIVEGARRFGLQSFLVRRILAQQPEFSVPALTLGLINAADPSPVPARVEKS